MIRQSSSAGSCKHLHSKDKKLCKNFCKRKKGRKKLLVTFTFVFENNQNSFSCGLTFGPFWSVK